MSHVIRFADPDRDAGAISAIYRPAVEETVATFEEVPPSAADFAGRIRSIQAWTPWLVVEDVASHEVVGYAYASRHRERAGYRWSVDVSAYIAPAHRGHGLGRLLYDALLAILRRQGFVNVYAGIAPPNPASVALHQAIGMLPIGVYERVGYKFGTWHDVAWYGMRLVDPPAEPADPIPIADLPPDPGA
ncbi:MAG: N-acetyltransferase family protein [Candidatus Limnocylindria bacterium]